MPHGDAIQRVKNLEWELAGAKQNGEFLKAMRLQRQIEAIKAREGIETKEN